MEKKVCSIVLNWNGWRDTSICVLSLLQQNYANHWVIVVDNGSTDDSVTRLRQEFPEITLIENKTNLGFAAGCNVGIREALAAGADFVWLLNSDAIADPNALHSLVETASRDPRIGAVG